MTESDTHETEAELRISRVEALNGSDLVSVVTYLLAKYPDTFPSMLDDALSSVSPKNSSKRSQERVSGQLAGRSVALVHLPVGPGLAGGAVLALDVVLAPADLGLRAGEPVRARGGHLGARAGLRDPVGGRGVPG